MVNDSQKSPGIGYIISSHPLASGYDAPGIFGEFRDGIELGFSERIVYYWHNDSIVHVSYESLLGTSNSSQDLKPQRAHHRNYQSQ